MRTPTPEEVEASVEYWHNHIAGDLSILEWLGWSWTEYADWVGDHSKIPQRPLANGMPNNLFNNGGENESQG